MNLPLNGRIAIIDDKYKEVKPLMDFFSKKRIAFNYYTGLKIVDFPLDPNENPITLLFLDLNIVESQHTPKAVISTLHPILKSICPSKSKPYCLVIWSKKINDFADNLDKHFRNNPELKNKQPVKTIRLKKSDYFSYIDGAYVFQDDKFQLLQEILHSELENISLMKNLLTWENIVHQNISETISVFSSLYPISKDWDKNMKVIMFHLAKAVIGNDYIKSTSDDLKLFAAFSGLNSFLAEKIQDSISDNNLGTIENVKDDIWEASSSNKKKDSLNSKVKAEINSKLHLIRKLSKLDSFEQGNIYFIKNENNLLKQILWKEKYGKFITVNILKSKPNLIQLDLTPVCDYSQDKKYIRIIHGIILNSKYHMSFDNSNYQIKTPIFLINKKEKFFLFDFRFIKTTTKNEIEKRKIVPTIKLRREICTDIQSQLSNQVNRPGISEL
ncbi:MAG: hypothetical protein P1P88_16400 [Bacteroidales bacterium]|nr:hypothetical protein [Bacteroidales bacterium]